MIRSLGAMFRKNPETQEVTQPLEDPRTLIAENIALREQLAGVGKERDDLRELGHKAGLVEIARQRADYLATRFRWQHEAVCHELFGPPQRLPAPPKEIPGHLVGHFTLGGRVPVEPVYFDETYPANWPLIYRDEELDAYLADIAAGRNFIYGTVDNWVQELFARHPIAGLDVVTMGSRTPWYEAMILAHGGRPWALDYNKILCRSARIKTMTTAEWDSDPRRFDYALSISSFEHDGLGAYGDPLDPEGDLKAMRKMRRILKPGGLLLLAVPTGQDKILFNQARIYGRLRYPLLTEGWERVDSAGWYEGVLDANGDRQPVVALRNPG